jgi:hypothetical protein
MKLLYLLKSCFPFNHTNTESNIKYRGFVWAQEGLPGSVSPSRLQGFVGGVGCQCEAVGCLVLGWEREPDLLHLLLLPMSISCSGSSRVRTNQKNGGHGRLHSCTYTVQPSSRAKGPAQGPSSDPLLRPGLLWNERKINTSTSINYELPSTNTAHNTFIVPIVNC